MIQTARAALPDAYTDAAMLAIVCTTGIQMMTDNDQVASKLEWRCSGAGGELFHHLDLAGAFDEATAMFYAANVLLALEHLHSRGLVYRDLKPENLLLDAHGYCKVADFGFAKKIGADKTYTICGTPDYQVSLPFCLTVFLLNATNSPSASATNDVAKLNFLLAVE